MAVGLKGWCRRFAVAGFALFTVFMTNAPAGAVTSWQQPKTPPLTTPWTHLVGPDNALPDYPRPQMARTRWLNLNGVWSYTGRPDANAKPPSPNDQRRTA